MHENEFPWNYYTASAAAASNNLELLKYLHENGCPWNATVILESARRSIDCLKYALEIDSRDAKSVITDSICSVAALGGNLEALKYLYESGYPIGSSCRRAAASGKLDCLKYAHEHGGEWDQTITDAARGGHIDCIEYALKNGDRTLADRTYKESPINAAVESGNIECVKYLLANGADWVDEVYETAAQNNDLPMVKYLLEVAHRPIPQTNDVCKAACGNVELLRYLHEHGFKWDRDDYGLSFHFVQRRGLASLKYLLECGYELDTSDASLCSAAAYNDDVEMLEFLLNLGCEVNYNTIENAVSLAALEAVKCLHKHSVELDDSLALWAVYHQQHKVLRYLLKHGCGLYSMVCTAAASQCDMKGLRIAHKYGVPWTANTCLTAMKFKRYMDDDNLAHHRFKIIKFLHEHGCPWSHQECTLAAQQNDSRLLKYAHEHGSQWNSETWCAAVGDDALECLEYLLANGCPQDPSTYSSKHRPRCYEFMQKNNLVPTNAKPSK